MGHKVISRRGIVMGIVGMFLAGWFVFVLAAPRDPVIGKYLVQDLPNDESYHFRSDGTFVRFSGNRQLAAGQWDFRESEEVATQILWGPRSTKEFVTAREYTLLTETFEPGQHTPDRVFLVAEPGCLIVDGRPFLPSGAWFKQIQDWFRNWFR